MILMIINKILIITFVLSILNIIRHGYYFVQAWFKSETDEPVRYIITGKNLFFLGLSLAYFITGLFSGITF